MSNQLFFSSHSLEDARARITLQQDSARVWHVGPCFRIDAEWDPEGRWLGAAVHELAARVEAAAPEGANWHVVARVEDMDCAWVLMKPEAGAEAKRAWAILQGIQQGSPPAASPRVDAWHLSVRLGEREGKAGFEPTLAVSLREGSLRELRVALHLLAREVERATPEGETWNVEVRELGDGRGEVYLELYGSEETEEELLAEEKRAMEVLESITRRSGAPAPGDSLAR